MPTDLRPGVEDHGVAVPWPCTEVSTVSETSKPGTRLPWKASMNTYEPACSSVTAGLTAGDVVGAGARPRTGRSRRRPSASQQVLDRGGVAHRLGGEPDAGVPVRLQHAVALVGLDAAQDQPRRGVDQAGQVQRLLRRPGAAPGHARRPGRPGRRSVAPAAVIAADRSRDVARVVHHEGQVGVAGQRPPRRRSCPRRSPGWPPARCRHRRPPSPRPPRSWRRSPRSPRHRSAAARYRGTSAPWCAAAASRPGRQARPSSSRCCWFIRFTSTISAGVCSAVQRRVPVPAVLLLDALSGRQPGPPPVTHRTGPAGPWHMDARSRSLLLR